MVWDATKSPGDLITSSDWNDMVTDQKNHASRHSDGGSDELDAADLSGASGTSGQVLQTDGSAASWSEPSGGTDQQIVDSNKVLQQSLKFGAEGSTTTSTSFIVVPDSDIAVDFDTFKNQNGNVFVKAKYHMRNSTPRGASVGTVNSLSRDFTGATYLNQPVLVGTDINTYDFSANSTSAEKLFVPYSLATDSITLENSFNLSNSNDVSIPTAQDMYTCSGSTVASYDMPEEVLFRASSRNTFDTSTQTSSCEGVTWNNDGSKMYVVSSSDSSVYSYSGSSYDLTSLSSTNSFDVSGQATDPSAIAFNGDGSKMYIVGRSSTAIYSYNLSTAFDITTASSANSFSLSTNFSTPTGIDWDNTGNGAFVSGSSSSDLYKIDLSTAYDLTTASFGNSETLQTSPEGVQYHSSGYFITYVGGGTAYQESKGPEPSNAITALSSNYLVWSGPQGLIYEIPSGGSISSFYDAKPILGITTPPSLSSDGNNIFAAPRQANSPYTIYEISVGTSLTQQNTYDVSFSASSLAGLFYDSSNSSFFVFETGSRTAIELDSGFNRTGFEFDIGSQVDDGSTGGKNLGYYNPSTDEYICTDNIENGLESLANFESSPGQANARIFRQNDGTVVSGSEAGGDAGDVWNFFETGWIDLSNESGNESYQIELSTTDKGEAFYNSMVLHIATPE